MTNNKIKEKDAKPDKDKDPRDNDVRKVLMSKEVMDQFATRTEDGALVSWDWGDPDEDGYYTPTVTIVDEDPLETPGGTGDTKDG